MSNPETVISLESYAAVMAGLGAGLGIRRALAHAGVPPEAWERASERWQAEIDESAASDLTLLVAFDAALLTAKRRFEPTFEPIESDVRAWAHFRRHFATAVDPVAFLARHDLTLAMVARIEASWANRILADEALAAELRGHMEAPLEDCPTLTRTPSPLLAAADAEPAQEAPAAAPPEARPIDPLPPAPPPVAPPPVQVPGHLPVYLADPPQPTRVDRAARASAQRVDTTGPMPAIQLTDVLPFQRSAPQTPAAAEEAPPPIPLERYAVMLTDLTIFGMTEAQLCEKHRMTPAQRAKAFHYWQSRVSADAALHDRLRVVMERYQAVIATTRERPQARSSAPPPAIVQAAIPPAAELRLDLRRTLDPGAGVMSPVLPFVAGASPAPNQRESALPAAAPGGPATVADEAPGAPVQLSIEQYASLTVDLALVPERTAETLRRCRLTPAQKAHLDAAWTARLAASPPERDAFDAACAAYRAWRLRSTSKP